MANDAKVVCKNVFKIVIDGVYKSHYSKWIELINQYEK